MSNDNMRTPGRRKIFVSGCATTPADFTAKWRSWRSRGPLSSRSPILQIPLRRQQRFGY